MGEGTGSVDKSSGEALAKLCNLSEGDNHICPQGLVRIKWDDTHKRSKLQFGGLVSRVSLLLTVGK